MHGKSIFLNLSLKTCQFSSGYRSQPEFFLSNGLGGGKVHEKGQALAKKFIPQALEMIDNFCCTPTAKIDQLLPRANALEFNKL
jgi:hypothetical protein